MDVAIGPVLLTGNFQQTSLSSLVNQNVQALGGRTSLRLEPELWEALDEVCRREGCRRNDVVQWAEAMMMTGSRTSALRRYLFEYFSSAVTEAGHKTAGHRE